MQIILKDLKIYPRLSQETTAYNADIWVDGVRTLAASNDGHGGADRYHRYPEAKVSEAEIEAWLRANEKFEFEFEILGQFVGRLISRSETEKTLRRKLAKSVVAIEGNEVVAYKATAAQAAEFNKRYPDKRVVNDDPEAFKAAVDILMKQDA